MTILVIFLREMNVKIKSKLKSNPEVSICKIENLYANKDIYMSYRNHRLIALINKTDREHALPAQNSFGLLIRGYCERKNPKS